ncbi:Uncharacterised protein [Vibrio cholerae]|nr:Uncharacterised protein [Vibrio cholerae]
MSTRFNHRHFQIRKVAFKRHNDLREKVRAHHAWRAKTHLAFHNTFELINRQLGIIDLLQNALGMFKQHCTFMGQRNFSFIPFKQSNTELLLKFFNRNTQCRLRNM